MIAAELNRQIEALLRREDLYPRVRELVYLADAELQYGKRKECIRLLERAELLQYSILETDKYVRENHVVHSKVGQCVMCHEFITYPKDYDVYKNKQYLCRSCHSSLIGE